MKKFILLFVVLITVLSNNAVAQYSNSTLNGPWFVYTLPMSPYNNNLMYFVFDGNGHITDFSGFSTTVGGTYSVYSNGEISGELIEDGTSFLFSGHFASPEDGIISFKGYNSILSKISNPGELMDTLVGSLLTENCGRKEVVIRLNNQGQITYSNGLTEPVSGRIYSDLGMFLGHIKTGGGPIGTASAWHEITIMGYFENDTLNGLVGLDQSGCGVSLTQLFRINTSSGFPEDRNLRFDIMINPNPATDIVNLEINNNYSSDLILHIYNMLGKEVLSQKITQNEQQINVKELANGIYIIEIKSNEISEVQKLIIQK